MLPRNLSAHSADSTVNGPRDYSEISGVAGGWREGCLRAGARTALTEREGQHSSERDSEAASLDTRRCYFSMNRAVGIKGEGGDSVPRVHASAGYGTEEALKITALVSGEVKQGESPGAQE